MKNLETFLNKLAVPSNIFLVVFLVVSAAGFADATYLTAKHFLGEPITCSVLKGCEQVTTSHYSIFLGQPVAFWGSLYYFSVLLLTALYLQTRKRLLFLAANILTIAGFLISLRFVYLQVVVIKAICIFCMGSAASSTILFILSIFSLKKKKITDPSFTATPTE